MFHQKNRCFYTQIWKLWVLDYHRNSSMFSNKIDIFIGKIAHTVRMFRHGETLLLPHARRIVQHRDRTRRGNSHFRSTLCSALDLASFPSGQTSVLGLELRTRLRFVDWITGEIAPLSKLTRPSTMTNRAPHLAISYWLHREDCMKTKKYSCHMCLLFVLLLIRDSFWV